MERLGAKRFYKRGAGDDCQDIMADFDDWRSGGFFESLKDVASKAVPNNTQKTPGKKQVQKKVQALVCTGGERGDKMVGTLAEASMAILKDEGLDVRGPLDLSERRVEEKLAAVPEGGVIFILTTGSEGEGLGAGARKLTRRVRTECSAGTLKGRCYQVIVLPSNNATSEEVKKAAGADVDALCKALELVGASACSDVTFAETGDSALDNLATAVAAVCGGPAEEADNNNAAGEEDNAAPAPKQLTVHLMQDAKSLPSCPEMAGEACDTLGKFYFKAIPMTIATVKELRQKPEPELGLSTVQVDFKAKEVGLEFEAGDSLEILPRNSAADVEWFASMLGCTSMLDWHLCFAAPGASKGIKQPFPTPCTVREALTSYCDLGRVPSKTVLAGIRDALEGDQKKNLDILLTSPEALAAVMSEDISLTLREFWELVLGPTPEMGLGTFLQVCARQSYRTFTIASSPLSTPGRIHIAASMLSKELPSVEATVQLLQKCGLQNVTATQLLPRRFSGVCSRWLCTELKAGISVLSRVRASAFRLPAQLDAPIIMVGAGAGVAPFRAFVQHLRSPKVKETPDTMLIFGCRNAESDWIYKDELQQAVKLGGAAGRMQVGARRPLCNYYTAFSRQAGQPKMYVQDCMRQNSEQIKEWWGRGARVYVCGSTGMARGVVAALMEIVDCTEKDLTTSKRLILEAWG